MTDQAERRAFVTQHIRDFAKVIVWFTHEGAFAATFYDEDDNVVLSARSDKPIVEIDAGHGANRILDPVLVNQFVDVFGEPA